MRRWRWTAALAFAALVLAVPRVDAAPTTTTVPPSTTSTTSDVVVVGKSRFKLPLDLGLTRASAAITVALEPGGPLDIVTANSDGTVTVIVNDGKGSFAKPVTYVASTKYPVSSLDAADLNGDGKPDIVAAVSDPSSVEGIVSFLGRGDGRLGPAIVTSTVVPLTGYQDTARTIAAGRLTGSRDVDVVVGFSPGGANPAVIRLYPGLGNGHFGPSTQTIGAGSTYGSVGQLLVAPLGKDGIEGLVVNDTGCGYNVGHPLVFMPEAKGLTLTFQGPGCPSNIVAADLNGDRITDLLTTVGQVLQTPRSGALLIGKGDGTYAPAVSLNLGAAPNTVTVGDFNGDRKIDIAAGDGPDVALVDGLGKGRFGPPAKLPLGGPKSFLLTVDLNGDGAKDIVSVGGTVTVLINATRVPKGTLSTIASSLATPRQPFKSVGHVAVGGSLALAALLFITFPAGLFNETFEANYNEIIGWWRRAVALTRRLFPVRPPPPIEGEGEAAAATAASTAIVTAEAREASDRERVAFVAVLVIGGVLGSLLDPHFGMSWASAETLAAVMLATVIGLARSGVVTGAYHQLRFKQRAWRLHALPGGLAVAGVCVLISRLTSFQPGYLYGVVCGVAFAHELANEEHGHVAALTTLATLVTGVLAWWAWLPIHVTAGRSGTFFGEVITADLLAAVFVGGLVGCALSMIPLRFLAGSKVRAWRTDVWAALFLLALFGVVDVLLISHGRTAPKTSTPFVTTAVLFVLFGGGSLAFREFFARRARGLSVTAEAAG